MQKAHRLRKKCKADIFHTTLHFYFVRTYSSRIIHSRTKNYNLHIYKVLDIFILRLKFSLEVQKPMGRPASP